MLAAGESKAFLESLESQSGSDAAMLRVAFPERWGEILRFPADLRAREIEHARERGATPHGLLTLDDYETLMRAATKTAPKRKRAPKNARAA